MGRRSINTTKSGKYMNPTDQARKEARKRELKKNKRQRMAVRLAVLKGKDPHQLLEEMEKIDLMEYDPTQPPQLNERVLKEKRRKLKETYERVILMYEKEDPEYAMELKKSEIEYEKKRFQMQTYYEQVKHAEKVKLDNIPLPEAPSFQAISSNIPLPGDIPLPAFPKVVHGILKKSSQYERNKQISLAKKRKPPGPPMGPPPSLSDNEYNNEDDEVDDIDGRHIGEATTQKGMRNNNERDVSGTNKKQMDDQASSNKKRKIRFEDDGQEKEEEEKDTRLKFKMTPAAIQAKRLMTSPSISNPLRDDDDEEENSSSDEEDIRKDEAVESDMEKHQGITDDDDDEIMEGDDDVDNEHNTDTNSDMKERESQQLANRSEESAIHSNNTLLPPGPPPIMYRHASIVGRGVTYNTNPPRMPPGPPINSNNLPRMLPPGPPTNRPPPGIMLNMSGIPLPPMNMPRGMPPHRMPPPGMIPLPINPGQQQHNMQQRQQMTLAQNRQPMVQQPTPGVLSAPPTLVKNQLNTINKESISSSSSTISTIVAKPKIKNLIGDATRFTPVAVKIKREMKDSKGQLIKPSARQDDQMQLKNKQQAGLVIQPQTKDDAYDVFMKEMEGLL